MTTKAAWRQAFLTRRAGVPFGEDSAARHLLPLLAGARTVASYWPLPGEPSTFFLNSACVDRGLTVLLPRLLPSADLEFVPWAPDVELRPGLRGTTAPVGDPVPLGSAELVVVPALAVDRSGIRLGRGGGSYDRALAAYAGTAVAVLAFDEEYVDTLPAQPHDVAVSAVARPGGLLWIS